MKFMRHRKEPPAPRLARVTMLGADIDRARDLATWLLAHLEAGDLGALCRADGRPATDPVDELHLTIDAPFKQRALAESCALAAEMQWVRANHFRNLAHVADPGHRSLIHADLIADVRTEPDEAARRSDLAMDMAFLCPQALLVMHNSAADLRDELEAAFRDRALPQPPA